MSENKNFSDVVRSLVSQIPERRVMTYGQLAALAGSPQSARIVGGIAHFGDPKLPWHRVVNKQGGLASGYPGGKKGHKEHLEAEGIVVNGESGNYSVDVEKLIWWPQQTTKEYIKTQSNKPPTIFIVGPTASGKSSVAMKLAQKVQGEIICADSQTLRRSLDIGTAKPSKQDRKEIPHHLLDVIDPYENFSVNQFKILASKAIEDITRRNKVPIIVGGTGLYIDALFFDFDVDVPTQNSDKKNALEELPVEALQKIIIENHYDMPLNKNNPRHLIGVILREGTVHKNTEPIENTYIFGLLPGDDELKNRISERVEMMFSEGFIEEVRSVLEKYGRPKNRMDAIGYPAVMKFIDGELSFEEAKQLFVRGHWQYARRQKAWFKRNPYIQWLNNDESVVENIITEVKFS